MLFLFMDIFSIFRSALGVGVGETCPHFSLGWLTYSEANKTFVQDPDFKVSCSPGKLIIIKLIMNYGFPLTLFLVARAGKKLHKFDHSQ
jgi:hypothetical protein